MPRLGLLADSHGRAAITRAAVEVLLRAGAERLIHLGDVGGEAVLDAMVCQAPRDGGTVPAHVVFGNTDHDRDALARYARHIGLTVDDPVGRIEVERGPLVFMHGDDARAMAAAVAEGAAYLCHGHTHRRLDARRGRTRVINQGALYRAARYSVALLDTASDVLTFHEPDEPC